MAVVLLWKCQTLIGVTYDAARSTPTDTLPRHHPLPEDFPCQRSPPRSKQISKRDLKRRIDLRFMMTGKKKFLLPSISCPFEMKFLGWKGPCPYLLRTLASQLGWKGPCPYLLRTLTSQMGWKGPCPYLLRTLTSQLVHSPMYRLKRLPCSGNVGLHAHRHRRLVSSPFLR